jgi:hypothetical protein
MTWLLITLLALASGLPHSQRKRVGSIDFFGTGGIDVRRVRSVLPVHRDDEIAEDQSADMRDRLSRVIQNTVGHKPTDLAVMCCDNGGELTIYIGLGGGNTAVVPFLPRPKSSTCLPSDAVHLYDDTSAALERAIEQGHSSADDSRGYSLSADPTAREKQLAMHAYAMTHEGTIEQALQACENAEQRQAAAELLGYAAKSTSQIAFLLRASHDSDEGVRNNAVRALWVLATSNPTMASQIPPNDLIAMLNSGLWTDRNKAGMLLMALTRSRNRQLLQRLRSEALQSLIEMARWEDPGHASAYRVLLGRIAGLNETQIQQLVASKKVDEIIAAVVDDKSRVH